MVDDMGFRRHIPSEQVDRVVLGEIAGMMKGSEGYISEQTAKMLGQDDIFTKAMLERQLKDIDKQFDMLHPDRLAGGHTHLPGHGGLQDRNQRARRSCPGGAALRA